MTLVQCEVSYRRWLESKRKKEERMRNEQMLLLYQDVPLTEQRRARLKRVKDSKEVADWMKQKEQEKVEKTSEEYDAAYAAFEDRRKRLEGGLAYRRWLGTKKNQSTTEADLAYRRWVRSKKNKPTPAPSVTREPSKLQKANQPKNNLARFVFSPLVEAAPSPRAMRSRPERVRDVCEPRAPPCTARSPRNLQSLRRQLSPRHLRSPRRQLSPRNLLSLRRQLSPRHLRSPRRQLSPRNLQSLRRQRSPRNVRSSQRPLSPLIPRNFRSLRRQLSPRNFRSPRRQLSPRNLRSPKRQLSPLHLRNRRSPRRQLSPLTFYRNIRSPRRALSPRLGRKHSPLTRGLKSRYSVEIPYPIGFYY